MGGYPLTEIWFQIIEEVKKSLNHDAARATFAKCCLVSRELYKTFIEKLYQDVRLPPKPYMVPSMVGTVNQHSRLGHFIVSLDVNILETINKTMNPFCRGCKKNLKVPKTAMFCASCTAKIKDRDLTSFKYETEGGVRVKTHKDENLLALALIMLPNLKNLRLSYTKEISMNNYIYRIGTQQLDLTHHMFPTGTDPSLLDIETVASRNAPSTLGMCCQNVSTLSFSLTNVMAEFLQVRESDWGWNDTHHVKVVNINVPTSLISTPFEARVWGRPNRQGDGIDMEEIENAEAYGLWDEHLMEYRQGILGDILQIFTEHALTCLPGVGTLSIRLLHDGIL